MLDQNLTHELVPELNAHGNEHGLEFIPFPVYPNHGALDPEVVQIAQRNNAVAILTGDKSDFAAKKLYFGLDTPSNLSTDASAGSVGSRPLPYPAKPVRAS